MNDTILPSGHRALLILLPLLLLGLINAHNPTAGQPPAVQQPAAEVDRSPVDLVLTADEQRLLTVNQTANTVSLVRVANGKVLAEVPVGQRPSGIALTSDERKVVVTGTYAHDLTVLGLDGDQLKPLGKVYLGFEPRGVALSPKGDLAYVALTTAHAVAVVDLQALKVIDRIAVGKWPRYLALTPDGSRLAVGSNGDGGVCVVDTAARKMLYLEDFNGINLGQMHVSKDGKHVYFPWMVYRYNPITPNNIRIGWVLASRIARVRLDGPARREAIALDPQGLAVADPHGLALSPDEQWVVSAASGTQELLVYQLPGLPFQDYGGPGDHIDAKLLKDKSRHYRIDLGGRPMAVRYSKDGRHVYVTNYLLNCVQVVDVPGKKVARTISLGSPAVVGWSPDRLTPLARQGEAIFYDGKRSLDQWYSCHSCHYEGHTNSQTMDTRNDGNVPFTFKTVLSLRHVTHTGPWTWHGWQKDLRAAMSKSVKDTMLGKEPSERDVDALIAYFETLKGPPNPHRHRDGSLTEAAQRGEKIFKGTRADCARCHSGPYFTDGRIHNVNTGKRSDVYKGYNPPSLLGVYDRMLYLHDGRAKSLEEVLRGDHNPDRVTGRGELTEAELSDLLAYLRSL